MLDVRVTHDTQMMMMMLMMMVVVVVVVVVMVMMIETDGGSQTGDRCTGALISSESKANRTDALFATTRCQHTQLLTTDLIIVSVTQV